MIIYALIFSRLDSFILFYLLNHLQIVQNTLARRLTGASEHITPLLSPFHRLSVEFSILELCTDKL